MRFFTVLSFAFVPFALTHELAICDDLVPTEKTKLSDFDANLVKKVVTIYKIEMHRFSNRFELPKEEAEKLEILSDELKLRLLKSLADSKSYDVNSNHRYFVSRKFIELVGTRFGDHVSAEDQQNYLDARMRLTEFIAEVAREVVIFHLNHWLLFSDEQFDDLRKWTNTQDDSELFQSAYMVLLSANTMKPIIESLDLSSDKRFQALLRPSQRKLLRVLIEDSDESLRTICNAAMINRLEWMREEFQLDPKQVKRLQVLAKGAIAEYLDSPLKELTKEMLSTTELLPQMRRWQTHYDDVLSSEQVARLHAWQSQQSIQRNRLCQRLVAIELDSSISLPPETMRLLVEQLDQDTKPIENELFSIKKVLQPFLGLSREKIDRIVPKPCREPFVNLQGGVRKAYDWSAND